MDIISRIKLFMAHSGLSSSQLADSCDIPRPTMSQILNGRNKKISNELIARLHTQYPNLSVMWLMFGEGDMLVNSNTQTSEPQNGQNKHPQAAQQTENQINFMEFPFDNSVQDFHSEKSEKDISAVFAANQPSDPLMFDSSVRDFDFNGAAAAATQSSPSAEDSTAHEQNRSPLEALQQTAPSGKTVSAIMVFYTDNSYEMFTPQRGDR